MPDISIDFSNITGAIKPVHGVNNGPVTYGALLNVSRFYRELAIPYVRLHDTNWPHPREVDIPQIFPDFSKDPADPASYDFRRTDDYIQSILATGAAIFYRLGVSIEHTARQYDSHPPADFAKWAQICLGIIKHYNHGWADGFQYDIRYWEIWNEPDHGGDGTCMWSGTAAQYYDLYKVAARAIKAFDPTLKVGGFSATSNNPPFTRGFLEFCRKETLPLDFFSWHNYYGDLLSIRRMALEYKDLLDSHGFTDAESWLNEWNTSPDDWSRVFSRTGEEQYKRQTFENFRGVEAASFVTAAMLSMQELPIDFANYYDGQPNAWFCGLFDPYGVPQKPFYGFQTITRLVECGQKVRTAYAGESEEVYCCAARHTDGAEYCLVLSNSGAVPRTCRLRLAGLPAAQYVMERYLLDRAHDLELVSTRTGTEDTMTLTEELSDYTVAMYRLRPVMP
jgi:hypothetical protein